MAEAVFAHKVRQYGLEEHFGVIDSCGTADYHEGEEPDMRYVAMSNMTQNCARVQVEQRAYSPPGSRHSAGRFPQV